MLRTFMMIPGIDRPTRLDATESPRAGFTVLELLFVTMLIGLWLVWPVRDDWAGSGEVLPSEMANDHLPPERLAPGSSPLEPR